MSSESNNAAPRIDLRLREMLDGWKNSDYPLSYEGQCAQKALNACIADVEGLLIYARTKGGTPYDWKSDFFEANGAAVRAEGILIEVRDWFEAQAKLISKGCGSSWDLQQVRDMRDRCDAALQATSAEAKS